MEAPGSGRKPQAPSWAEKTPTRPAAQQSLRRGTTDDANLPAFFHVKAPDGSAGYNGAALDDTQVLTKDDEPAQWIKLWGEDADGIQMDRVSLFSVTPCKMADDMTKLLLTLPGISKDSSITDGTACVGGNTASFARYFAVVNAIEMDSNRCDMLINNVNACRIHAQARGTGDLPAVVKFFCDNSLELVPRLRQDIVFLDPPWGGKDYKSKTTVPLFLSAKPLHEVVLHCLRYSRYVALKLPKNADLTHMQTDVRVQPALTKEFPSFSLLVVTSPLKPKVPFGEPIGSHFTTETSSESKLETLLLNLVKTKPFQDILKSTVLGDQQQPKV